MKQVLSQLYGYVTQKRKDLYDQNILKSSSLSKPVIVVGNVTVGGTGKTPFVNYVVSLLQNKLHKNSGIISRGYKGSYTGVQKVDASQADAASVFGDEPSLLAALNSEVPVYVAKQKFVAGETLLKKEVKIDVIVSDDGFQHFALKRDLDIVLVDCTETLANYKLMPEGRLRESLGGLNRADVIVFTKKNWVAANQFSRIETYIKSHVKNNRVIFLSAQYNIEFPQVPDACDGLVLVSSIAKPQNFYETAVNNSDIPVKKHFIFKDHHKYSQADIADILEFMKLNKNCQLITTEKDWVKLKEFKELEGQLQLVKVSVELDDESLFERQLNDLFA